MTSSRAEKTGSKLGPMTQPYHPLAVILPALVVQRWNTNVIKLGSNFTWTQLFCTSYLAYA